MSLLLEIVLSFSSFAIKCVLALLRFSCVFMVFTKLYCVWYRHFYFIFCVFSAKHKDCYNRIYVILFFTVSALSLQELCCRTIVSSTTIYGIDQLPLPQPLKNHLKSYALTNKTRARMLSFIHRDLKDKYKKAKYLNPTDSPPSNCRKSCSIS